MKKSVNKVIKNLILSNFLLFTAWGFIGPVFAIFILQNIDAGNAGEAAKVAGFAFFIYWVLKSLFQIPISRYFDRMVGEKDDFWFMFLGLVITSFVPLGYLLASAPWHVYLSQVVHAFGMSLFIPAWNAIFTRHIDKGREAFEWAMDSTCLGIGYGITGAIGGLLASLFGFTIIFISIIIINLIAAATVLLIHKDILPKDHILSWIFSRPL